jgi:hypothetical protein
MRRSRALLTYVTFSRCLLFAPAAFAKDDDEAEPFQTAVYQGVAD